jgi:uridine phosphorylase
MPDTKMGTPVPPPILSDKHYEQPSVFTAGGLLREARRQKQLRDRPVPAVCVLDPDGDMVRQLTRSGRATLDPDWACYHTQLHRLTDGGIEFGIVGCAVGASFAVLVAEQLFAAGCRLLISVTSAGQLVVKGPPPYFIVIDQALRDEGTSYHYLAPARFARASTPLLAALDGAFADALVPVHVGASWTTDAPFRETAATIDARKAEGLLAVEMEAAALYAFAEATGNPVICLAFVTNQMAQISGDFEKGDGDGSVAALAVLRTIAAKLLAVV